jgi:hypothetical protein
MTAVLLDPVQYWKCPSCGTVDRTQQSTPHTQMHSCPALGNVIIPLLRVEDPDDKPDGRQVAVRREDYAGRANPVGAIRTERSDGSNDVTVLADPAAISAAS